MKNLSRTLLAVTAIAATLPASHAAVISWGSATTIASNSDVSTSGSLVSAFNISGGNTTISGVEFIGANMNGDQTKDLNGLGQVTIGFTGGDGNFGGWLDFTGFGSASAPFSNLTAPYQSLLSTGIFPNGGGGASLVLTFTNLTVGYTYEVQLWVNDSRGGSNQAQPIVDGPTLNSNTAPLFAAGGVGQFAIGTFTADSTSQVMQLNNGGQSLFLNATQLRLTAVPEPSTYAIFIVGTLGMLIACRRRRAQG